MLSDEELERYDRQLKIEGLGREGQEKLKRAKIMIAGAGGLGCPVAIYLAAAGVGCLRVVDKDRVESSNLNRQVLHWEKDIGQKKAMSAAKKLARLNPWIKVEAIAQAITEHNVLELTEGCDLIIDALDNYPTRYLLNRAAIKRRIPLVHGGIHGLEGMVTTIIPGKTPCLRCIFSQGPPPVTFPVLGVTPGIIGTIQAAEAIKYLVGVGELLTGRLLLFDGAILTFREVRVRRHPECPDCRELSSPS